jgi:hypothetical protein
VSVVEVTMQLPAPPQEVWDLVMDPQRLADWVTIHRELVSADDGPPRLGYKMSQRIHLRGITMQIDWTLSECVPGELAVWEGRGPARSKARTRYALKPFRSGTRFDYLNEFTAPMGPLGAVVSRALMGGIPESEARHSLEQLKTIISNSYR